MTTNIYDLHRATFANVSAFVIVKDGKRVDTVAFKFPREAVAIIDRMNGVALA